MENKLDIKKVIERIKKNMDESLMMISAKVLEEHERGLCFIFDHVNDISCVENTKYICDQCSRCGKKLPIAYPFHDELYKNRKIK